MKKNLIPVLFIIVFSIFGMKALLHPGYFTGHDTWHQVARFYHYHQLASGGIFPPYWVSSLANGLGYPLFYFSYHLPWIAGLPLLFAGIDIFTSLKILFILSYLTSGLLMYLFTDRLLKSKPAALLVSILYLWAPYRFSLILVSGAMGETFIFTFLPLVLWGIYYLYQRKNHLGVALFAIGLGLMLLSHLITVVTLIPLIGLFSTALFLKTHRKLEFVKMLLLGVLLTIGLSAFYLIPAVGYSRLTQVSSGSFNKIYQNNFVYFSQIVYSKWGYDINRGDIKHTNLSYQLGIAQWLSIGTAITILILRILRSKKFIERDKLPNYEILIILLLGTFIFSILAMIDLTRPAWDVVTKFISLDFPQKFLIAATTSASLLAGINYSCLKRKFRVVYILGLVVIVLAANRNYLRVNEYTNFPLSLYIGSESTTNSFNEYLPRAAQPDLQGEEYNSIVLPKTLEVSNAQRTSYSLSFLANPLIAQDISIGQFSFPGVVLYIDNQKKAYSADAAGRIQTTLQPGQHQVLVTYEDTGLIKIGKALSLLSLLIIGIIFGREIYGKK